MNYREDTIVALSTGQVDGAISILRLSGERALKIADQVFVPKNSKDWKSYEIKFGLIQDKEKILDEALVSYFAGPHSYTGEDVVEISCHSSSYIVQEVFELLIKNGATPALPGEFSFRRFLNGKMDLAQAEALRNLIESQTASERDIALRQMRGGYSDTLSELREELIQFAALIELELDFVEEDVEFADREKFLALLTDIQKEIANLIQSFAYGNVLKEGIPVAIAGKPNAGKSSLLNALLNEEKAIVSDIAGTTRDAIEDTLIIAHHKFRFIDTAGLRDTEDTIEKIGVEKAKEKVLQANILLYVYDELDTAPEEIMADLRSLSHDALEVILVRNKMDLLQNEKNTPHLKTLKSAMDSGLYSNHISISTKDLESLADLESLFKNYLDKFPQSSTVVSNTRHLHALERAQENLAAVKKGIEADLSGDLLSLDIRSALQYIGQITGEVDVDKDILGTIFGKFCIGK